MYNITYVSEISQTVSMVVNRYRFIIRNHLSELGLTVYGGKNAPYVWIKVPDGMTSWNFFDILLEKANVVGTPGSGFGASGEGYFRLSAFNSRVNVERAMERITSLK